MIPSGSHCLSVKRLCEKEPALGPQSQAVRRWQQRTPHPLPTRHLRTVEQAGEPGAVSLLSPPFLPTLGDHVRSPPMVCVSSGPEGQVRATLPRQHLRGQYLFLVTMGVSGPRAWPGSHHGLGRPLPRTPCPRGGESLPSVMHKLPPAQGTTAKAEAGVLWGGRGDPPRRRPAPPSF